MTTDPSILIDRALTEEQRQEIVTRFTTANPHWRGAQVPDIIDALDQADSNLAETEPFFEAWDGDLPPGIGMAARALIWSGTPLTEETLTVLVIAAGLETLDAD